MVLITERNETLSEIYGRLLSRAGRSVAVRKSIEESIVFIDNNVRSIELLVIGLRFPGEPERLLIDRVRRNSGDCKILVLADEMTEEVGAFIAEYGIDACLSKPFLPSDILKKIALFHPYVP